MIDSFPTRPVTSPVCRLTPRAPLRRQRLFSVAWSMDAAYVMSGSDDTNVRIWRAVANERGGKKLAREEQKQEYSKALIEKHKYLPDIKRIKNHTHVPRAIMKAASIKKTVEDTQLRREKNRRAHSKKGSMPKVSAKKKKIWKVEE